MADLSKLHPGDKVQVTRDAIDVTNGIRAGSRYVEGSSEWGFIQLIDSNWVADYGDHKGQVVNKVRILGTDNSTVVWQVEPQHVSDNIIHLNGCGDEPEPAPEPAVPVPEPEKPKFVRDDSIDGTAYNEKSGAATTTPFVTTPAAQTWKPIAGNTKQSRGTVRVESARFEVDKPIAEAPSASNSESIMDAFATPEKPLNEVIFVKNPITGKYSATVPNYQFNILNETKQKVIANDYAELIQNEGGFPYKVSDAVIDSQSEMKTAQYDYTIQIDDARNDKFNNLEDKLMEARAAFGLPVHGSSDMAKTMRYYLYNRFQVPDTNMAHNKSFTHVFFTRPDLNILANDKNGNAMISNQCLNHTESAMLWLKNPTLFKQLVDCKRCKDSNNFIMLLSNAITSFSIEDESLSTIDAGKSWNDYTVSYGDAYDGRSANEFTVNFVDDKEYSVLHLMKLWITYIDNVARGAWVPSYNLNGRSDPGKLITDSHVYTKTLDYAASAYAFKVAENGHDILYWTKYYGVFPVSTGASSLSWDKSTPPGEAPKPSIRFRYSAKRDMSPVSLLEFNANARVTDGNLVGGAVPYESAWANEYAHSTRPFVGTPFVEIRLPQATPTFRPNRASNANTASIKLMFQPDYTLIGKDMDKMMYRNTVTNAQSYIRKMKSNSQKWLKDEAGREGYANANVGLAQELAKETGRNIVRGDDGVWYYDYVGGMRVY